MQCGSEKGKEFIYGGFTDKGRWRREARDWFFAQQVPLFACTVNVKQAIFRLYQTSAKWMVRNECGHLRPAAVHLVPGGKFDPVRGTIPRKRVAKRKDDCRECDRFSYGIPLRDPVVELRVKDLTSKTMLRKAREAMRVAVEIERQNITHNHHLGVFASHWFTNITPNDPSRFGTAYGIAYNHEADAHLGPLFSSLWNTSLVLALNLHAQKKHAEIQHLAPVFRLFGSRALSADLLQRLPTKIVASLSATQSVP